MKKTISETSNDKKYFVLFETDAEGIRQYNALPESEKNGTSLCTMRVNGKIVPAIKLEVEKPAYDTFKREQWMEEYRFRQENRCIISGQNGKTRFCPCRIPNPEYTAQNGQPKTLANDCNCCPNNQMFRSFKGIIPFSALSLEDDRGNENCFNPVSTHETHSADSYMSLLYGWISYVNHHYPKYSKYTELIELLGHEFSLKEAAAILNIPQRTLYGWVQTLKPIFVEYLKTIDRI